MSSILKASYLRSSIRLELTLVLAGAVDSKLNCPGLVNSAVEMYSARMAGMKMTRRAWRDEVAGEDGGVAVDGGVDGGHGHADEEGGS
jgi:hypothetical protein